MKNAMALTLAGLLAAPSLGFAAAPDAVMVFARQGDKGSVSVGDKHFRTQAFKVRLVNAAKSEISLKNSCLVAQSAAGQSSGWIPWTRNSPPIPSSRAPPSKATRSSPPKTTRCTAHRWSG